MNFNSIHFLCFFPIVVLFYYLLAYRFRWIWLLISSYYFYMCWNPKYAILMFISTLITYLSGIGIGYFRKRDTNLIQNNRQAKFAFVAAIAINLLILFYYKYFNFFNDSLRYIWMSFGKTWQLNNFDIILPVGISFYTFHALGYIIDVYRKEYEPEKNFLKYALFVSFFPLLVAGPIVRAHDLLPQFHKNHKFDYDRIRSGLMLILWGLFQKIMIADRLSILVNTVYNNVNNYKGIQLIIATIFFSFQIFCDFSAYTDIAKGASQIMGFDLKGNFNRPYFASSIKDFWRRWHISLSSWFKDYLYFPLGGNRNGKLKTYRNIMLVFLISGLWHGANWTFILWGALHGLYQVLAMVSQNATDNIISWFKINKGGNSLKVFNIILTFMLVNFAWIFFRANNVQDVFYIIKHIVPFNLASLATLDDMGLSFDEFRISCLLIVLLVLIHFFQRKLELRKYIMNLWPPFQWIICTAVIAVILIYGMYGNNYDAAQFIYFQF